MKIASTLAQEVNCPKTASASRKQETSYSIKPCFLYIFLKSVTNSGVQKCFVYCKEFRLCLPATLYRTALRPKKYPHTSHRLAVKLSCSLKWLLFSSRCRQHSRSTLNFAEFSSFLPLEAIKMYYAGLSRANHGYWRCKLLYFRPMLRFKNFICLTADFPEFPQVITLS
jgi:hypothetical protein